MATTEGGDSPTAHPPEPSDADVVITTVVSADDPRPAGPSPAAALGGLPPDHDLDFRFQLDHEEDDLNWALGDGPPEAPGNGGAGPKELSALEERLAALEGVPANVDALGKAIRHELERCAGVLFGHDRALGALAARLDAMETAPRAREEEAASADGAPMPPAEQLDSFNRRLAAMEARVEPLEPLPTVVQALRRAVRASEDLINAETTAREQALTALAGDVATEAQARDDAVRRLMAQDLDRVRGVSTAQAKGLADVAERLAAAESRLEPLDKLPDDVAALSRILRRELDAVVSDNQARDQMLRRALQNEIDQLRSTSEAREALAAELATRLQALEARAAEAAQLHEQAMATTGGRLEALEARVVVVDRIGAEVEALRDTVTRELELLRAGGQAHDQVAGELTRRLSALDGRLARLDALPGELQSLRTAVLQEAERTVTSFRAVDERIGQLAWVPGEFQEARKRIMGLSSGQQAGQDRLRQLEGALESATQRLEVLWARLGSSPPPAPPT
jgi:chromosome segregation ATPase